jgi:FtsP/CotA-like multicopper oxidase with cupredoxin domain
MITRRQLLTSGTALLGTAALAPLARLAGARQADRILLQAEPAEAALMDEPGRMTPVWAYNARTPGPVLRVRRGAKLRVRLQNNLQQPTSIHWHGIRINNDMDGVVGLTQEAVPPGATFDYEFDVPDAGTFWYHPHHRTWEQMARGLYGMLIVEEDAPPEFDRELNFVADDWRLDSAGQIDAKSFGNLMDWAHQGRLGNWLTVNGASEAEFVVRSGERLRLRCANVANARIFEFDFDPKITNAHVIALDGQPVDPVEVAPDGLLLAPAQRADLMLDITGTPGQVIPIYARTGRERIQVAHFKIADTPPLRSGRPPEPVRLPDNPVARGLDSAGAQSIPLIMEGGAMGSLRQAFYKGELLDIRTLARKGKVWSFNTIVGMPAKPLAQIARGRTALINMVNKTAWPHAMHLHSHHFQVVERDGMRIAGAPWRDTELVRRDVQVKIAFVADNPGKWLFHCHMLEHQAAGMLTWIEVS